MRSIRSISRSRTLTNLRTPSSNAVLPCALPLASAWANSNLACCVTFMGAGACLWKALFVRHGQFGITFAHDFPHAQLREFFGQGVFPVEQATLQHGFILQETGDDFVQILLADARGLRALRCCQPIDFHMNLAGILVHAKVMTTGLVAFFAVIEAR